MQARYEELSLDTQGDGDVLDVTAHAQKALANAGFTDGLCTVFVAHSTCGMTTIECEPGCNADLNTVLEQIAPQDGGVEAQRAQRRLQRAFTRRAALIGPSVTIPFAAGELMLGTWQKIVCVDFDDRPRPPTPRHPAARLGRGRVDRRLDRRSGSPRSRRRSPRTTGR